MTKTRTDPVDELRRTSQPLPRTVTPLPRELVSSYIHRLADANLLNAEALRVAITGDRRARATPRIAVLERLSSFPANTLRHALPELQSPREQYPLFRDGPGCTLCCAARGATRPYRVWRQGPDDVLCRRHRRWITGDENGWNRDEQPSLADLPEIFRAHRLHRRLIRRHGRNDTSGAFHTATWILDEWRKSGAYDYSATTGFDQRVTTLLGSEWQTLPEGSTVTIAARYPQQVALARLLVSPFWKNLALQDHLEADRPRLEDRRSLANTIYQYRRTTGPSWEEMPRSQARALLSTYLLLDGPNLRKFLDELRRTVESRYRWNPFPHKPLGADLLGNGKYDPLVAWIQNQINEHLHPGQSQWEDTWPVGCTQLEE